MNLLLTWLDSIVWIDLFSNWLRLIFTLVGGTLQFGISFMVNDTLPVALHIEWRYINPFLPFLIIMITNSFMIIIIIP